MQSVLLHRPFASSPSRQALTSILCAIGAKKSLVGVTKWCADVAPVNGLPKLGDCWHMDSVDEILKLKPSLVIGSVPYKQETLAKLLEHPLSFLATNPRTLADIENDIRMLGRIAGRAAQAELLIRKMRQEFAAIAKKSLALKNKPRVYCEAWPNPRISSPPWVAEIAQICGGEMVLPPGQKVSDEQVASARPDVIVLAWAATGDKAKPQKSYQVAAWQRRSRHPQQAGPRRARRIAQHAGSAACRWSKTTLPHLAKRRNTRKTKNESHRGRSD